MFRRKEEAPRQHQMIVKENNEKGEMQQDEKLSRKGPLSFNTSESPHGRKMD